MNKGFGKDNKIFSSKSKPIIYNELIEKALHAHKNKNFLEAEIIYQKLFRIFKSTRYARADCIW